MDELQQREYDFFMRMAALAQQKVMELAPLRDDPGPGGKLFQQYIDDMENCKIWARRIKEGDGLREENQRFKEALQRIAAGNPASPGKWLSDIEMADIAREALGSPTNPKLT